MRYSRRLKGQSTLEYAMIIVFVVAALLAIQIYMKRGVQGKLRESADQVGEQFDAGNTSVTSNMTRTSKTIQEVTGGVTTVYTGGGPAGGEAKGTQEAIAQKGQETVAKW